MRQAEVPEQESFSCKKRLKFHPGKRASCAWCGQITSPRYSSLALRANKPLWLQPNPKPNILVHFYPFFPPFEFKESPSNIQSVVFFPQATVWKPIKRQLPGGSGISVDAKVPAVAVVSAWNGSDGWWNVRHHCCSWWIPPWEAWILSHFPLVPAPTFLYPSETLTMRYLGSVPFPWSLNGKLYPCNLLRKPQLCHATRRGTNLSGDATATEDRRGTIQY